MNITKQENTVRPCVAGTHGAGTALGSGEGQPTYAELSCADKSAQALLRQGGTAADRSVRVMGCNA
jgi:hypothetical protein